MEELTWKQRYDRMKRHYGWTDENVAEHVGQSAKAIKSNVNTTTIGKNFPSALRGMIVVYEIENNLREHTVFI